MSSSCSLVPISEREAPNDARGWLLRTFIDPRCPRRLHRTSYLFTALDDLRRLFVVRSPRKFRCRPPAIRLSDLFAVAVDVDARRSTNDSGRRCQSDGPISSYTSTTCHATSDDGQYGGGSGNGRQSVVHVPARSSISSRRFPKRLSPPRDSRYRCRRRGSRQSTDAERIGAVREDVQAEAHQIGLHAGGRRASVDRLRQSVRSDDDMSFRGGAVEFQEHGQIARAASSVARGRREQFGRTASRREDASEEAKEAHGDRIVDERSSREALHRSSETVGAGNQPFGGATESRKGSHSSLVLQSTSKGEAKSFGVGFGRRRRSSLLEFVERVHSLLWYAAVDDVPKKRSVANGALRGEEEREKPPQWFEKELTLSHIYLAIICMSICLTTITTNELDYLDKLFCHAGPSAISRLSL